MAVNLLTATECRSAICKRKAISKLHDGDGLYLWVYPDGKRYLPCPASSAFAHKSLSLGVFPTVSLKDARRAGLDPSAERKATHQQKRLAIANSFEAVAWSGTKSSGAHG